MTRSRRTPALHFLAALLTGVAGFAAFNVVDTVFGVPEAIVGLVACVALTAFVYRRSPPGAEASDA